ncbi:MAG TPA: four helix bundle protein [Phycisphaerae bacterium]|nr:four helix bundle protein [Phycisphaerae bacterium]HRW51368.1 four helix bundle protein [Phycisphaerae bacterium]
MTPDELQKRATSFSLRIIKLARSLPNDIVGWELGKQILRSGTSVSSNYRAARRARSHKEFVAKLGIVAEEADETEHWLGLLTESGIVNRNRAADLMREADELTRIFASSKATARMAMKGQD